MSQHAYQHVASLPHDLCVDLNGVPPLVDVRIAWGLHPSPFGTCLVAATSRGICGLGFECPQAEVNSRSDRMSLLRDMQRSFPQAELMQDQKTSKIWAERAFAAKQQQQKTGSLRLFVAGTNFQLQVWRALLAIPEGRVTTYQGIANALNTPGASRAVGTAVGKNPISWLIPCHRVIRAQGGTGQYRWGAERKRAMLSWEAARTLA